MCTDPKSAKRPSSHKVSFALMGSACTKVARKTLVKLTTGRCRLSFSLPHLPTHKQKYTKHGSIPPIFCLQFLCRKKFEAFHSKLCQIMTLSAKLSKFVVKFPALFGKMYRFPLLLFSANNQNSEKQSSE